MLDMLPILPPPLRVLLTIGLVALVVGLFSLDRLKPYPLYNHHQHLQTVSCSR